MPDTGLNFGPAVVVNLADREPSGKSELRRSPKPEAAVAVSCSSTFVDSVAGVSISKAVMI